MPMCFSFDVAFIFLLSEVPEWREQHGAGGVPSGVEQQYRDIRQPYEE